MNFKNELEGLLNKWSMENGSNTPDFVLAKYMLDCLTAFDIAVNDREHWYGRNQKDFQDTRNLTLREAESGDGQQDSLDNLENDRPKACDKLDHDICRSRFVGYKFCPDCGERLSSELASG